MDKGTEQPKPTMKEKCRRGRGRFAGDDGPCHVLDRSGRPNQIDFRVLRHDTNLGVAAMFGEKNKTKFQVFFDRPMRSKDGQPTRRPPRLGGAILSSRPSRGRMATPINLDCGSR
jgi:hypothetical protein